MNRRIKENKGFTFIEMLLSVALLGFLSLVVAAGSTTALNVYREGVGYAESRTLSAVLLMSLENELRYATNLSVDADGNLTEFNSPNYNKASFLVEDGMVIVEMDTGGNMDRFPIVGEKMYTNGQGVASLELREVKDTVPPYGKLISVKVEMKDGNILETSILNLNAK